jgi:hypothetical protein
MLHTIDTEKRNMFASVYLIEHMVNKSNGIVKDASENENLKPILNWMEIKDLAKMDGIKCIPTQKGKDLLKQFMGRYTDFLQIFDVYCAIDLEEGKFAFESYFDMEPDAWETFIDNERWEDLRIAIALEKNIDPIEIVFMSFLNENRFGQDENGEWKTDLLIGTIWDEITNICNLAISKDRLVYDEVSGESVIKDIIEQGTKLMVELHKKEDETDDTCIPQYEADEAGFGEVVEETVTEEIIDEDVCEVDCFGYDYYEPYYDPFYISPVWGVCLYDPYW